MLLVLDIGNTNMVIGVYKGEELLDSWRLETKKERTGDELGILLRDLLAFSKISSELINRMCIANVVPTMTFAIEEMAARYFHLKPFFITASCVSPIQIDLDHPAELGADRLVNAVAAHQEYPGNSLIIDFGTATTFDVVSADGHYYGGAICPGLSISANALFQHAAKLPRVEIIKPATAIGKSTVTAMQSGLYWGYVGLVENLIDKISAELQEKPNVIATGGLAAVIAHGTKKIDVIDEWLTLKGLRILAELQMLQERSL